MAPGTSTYSVSLGGPGSSGISSQSTVTIALELMKNLNWGLRWEMRGRCFVTAACSSSRKLSVSYAQRIIPSLMRAGLSLNAALPGVTSMPNPMASSTALWSFG